MSKNKIEILALIDRSGSMYNIIEEAVGAFNAFIGEQRELGVDDVVKVTLAAFDDKYEVIYDRVALDKVKELTVSDVRPRGMTALYDSIGKLIMGAKYPTRDTILLIQTDGHENMSKEFNQTAIKAMIKEREAMGWDVNFIGAGIDAVEEGSKFGISANKAYSVTSDAAGMDMFKTNISCATASYRSNKFEESLKADGQVTDEGS